MRVVQCRRPEGATLSLGEGRLVGSDSGANEQVYSSLDQSLRLSFRLVRKRGSLPGVVADEETSPHLEILTLEPELAEHLPDPGEPLIVDVKNPGENLGVFLGPGLER